MAREYLSDTRAELLLVTQLFVSSGPRVDSQGLGVTNARRLVSIVNYRLLWCRTYFARLEMSLKLSTT
jgi:hypothetical protein